MMVWGTMATRSVRHESGRNATSLIFVAFERSIGADLDLPRSRNKSSAWTKAPSRRTEEVVGNIEGFKGTRTSIHQRHRRRKIFIVKCPSELPEVGIAWEGQRSTGNRLCASHQIKRVEGSSKLGWAPRYLSPFYRCFRPISRAK